MRPFRAVALGVLVVVLTVGAAGVDLLTDPIGWVLVLLGVRTLPSGYPLRRAVLGAVAMAFLVSLPLVLPSTREAVAGAGDAVGWAFSLPSVLALGLLAHAAGSAAGDAGDRGRSAVYRATEAGFLVVAVLPVLVLGAGVELLATPAGLLVVITPVVLLVSLFFDADRPWAAASRKVAGAG